MAKRKNGNNGNHGAKGRSGRKPTATTLLKREMSKRGYDEAQKSFDWLCEWRDDSDVPTALRIECAKVIMDRVLGKPAQPMVIEDWREAALKDGYDPERIFARLVEVGRAAMVQQSHDRSNGRGQAADDSDDTD